MCDVLYAVLYVRVNGFVVRGCFVLRRFYINVCNCDIVSVVNVYLDHLKFCVVCINGRRYVLCSEWYVILTSVMCPLLVLVRHIGAHCGDVMCLGSLCCMCELGFLYYDDICMCVVNNQFELLEIVFNSVYIDLKYNEIYLTFTAGYMCLTYV